MNVLDRDQKEAIIKITEYIRTNVDIKKIILDRKKESVNLNKELEAEIFKKSKLEKDNSELEKDYDSINTELKSNELKFTKLKNEFRNLSIILEECLLEIAEKKALIDNLKNEV
jgi:ABC-type phosphate transport system auxiliary subunit